MWRPPRSGTPEPFLRYWVVAPTFDLCQVAQQELSRIFDRSKWQPRWSGKHGKVYQQCWLGRTGVLIEFRSAERPNALVSVGLDGLWIDEAARLKVDAWQGNLHQRLGDRDGWAIFSTTPLGPNWFFLEVFQRGVHDPSSRWYDPTRTSGEYHSEHWTTRDNPHPRVQEYVARAEQELPRRFLQREIEASPDAFHGQIYETLDASLLRDERGPWDEVWAGVDHGHGHPGAIIVVGRKWLEGHWHYHVIDEAVHERWTVDEWIAQAWSFVTAHRVAYYYADPSGAQINATWAQRGLPMRSTKHLHDVAAGIQSVARLFHQRRLTIASRCVHLIRELRAYRYAEGSGGELLDRPVKVADDACDALRYAVHSRWLAGELRAA